MTYQVFSFHSSNSTNDNNRPDEDYLLVKDNFFAVFDGVTLLHQDPYPNHSPAYEVSKIAAHESLDSYLKGRSLMEAFHLASNSINRWNNTNGLNSKTVDHIGKQYASTVGVIAAIKDDQLSFAQINDCGVMTYDAQQNRELDIVSNNQLIKPLLQALQVQHNFDSGSKEEHIFFRSQIVNNLDVEFQGQKVNFGVLNGQTEALNLIRYGSINLIPNQVIILYSYGMGPYLYDQEFVNSLFKSQSDVEEYIRSRESEDQKYQKEKSLIVIKTT